MSGIFKAYDIRGTYPQEINEDIAKRIGCAFVDYLQAKRIVVGRDMRLSSPSLTRSFIQGAVNSKAQVVDIGMCTSPLLYYAISNGEFDGGAMITASHLPADKNGIKLCRGKAIPLSRDHGLLDIERITNEEKIISKKDLPLSVEEESIIDKYINHLAGFVQDPLPLKAVIDFGNGMAGAEVLGLFTKFPRWKMISMYMEPNGSFPHHVANPLIPSNTQDLQATVLKEKADIGIAFDGDADRCGFIDEKGDRIPEDLVTALIAQFLLSKDKGGTVLYDLRSSHIVPETIKNAGGKPVRCRIGHSFIKAKMREENAVFAGELSGHYYFRDTGFTDNAVFAMIQILNLLALKRVPVSQLVEPLKKYFKSGEINIEVKDPNNIFLSLKEQYKDAKPDNLDGLTIEYDSWWFNLRASNTEPVIRLNLEANSDELLNEKKSDLLSKIKYIEEGAKILS